MSNVRQFGAAGDGQRDDTDAIEHAIRDGDGLLEFPRGVYRITRPVVIPLKEFAPLAVHGSGGTAKLVMAVAGPAPPPGTPPSRRRAPPAPAPPQTGPPA